MKNYSKVTRFKIIDQTKEKICGGDGVFAVWNDKITIGLDFQDGDRTLKIFIKDKQTKYKEGDLVEYKWGGLHYHGVIVNIADDYRIDSFCGEVGVPESDIVRKIDK